MKYFILFFISTAAIAACEKSVSNADLALLKSGSAPAVLKFNCAGKACTCMDAFPYPINTDGAKLMNDSYGVDPAKEKVMKDAEAAAQAIKDAKAASVAALKEKIKSGSANAQDQAEALKLLMEKL